jgi:cytochrome c553
LQGLEEFRVTWRLAPIIGLVVLLCPVMAKAQTNLDQGKSASQIFANACVECHKEARGLAKGRSASALTEFLREHYTTNAQQAAQLAAYVLGGRSADTAPTGPATQGRAKPVPERAATEEPKPNRQGRVSGKPEERPTRNPAGQTARPSEQASPNEQPTIMRPIVGPAPTARNRRKEQRVPAPTPSEPDNAGMQAPAAAAAEPAGASEPPNREPSREPSSSATSAVPTEAAPLQSAPAASGDNSAVPRDHIPD